MVPKSYFGISNIAASVVCECEEVLVHEAQEAAYLDPLHVFFGFAQWYTSSMLIVTWIYLRTPKGSHFFK